MTSEQPQPIVPESRGPLVAVAVAAVVALSQVLAFYTATRLTASVRLPIRRGVLLLCVLLVAGAAASAAIRAIKPHRGSGYAIPLLATVGFVAVFAVTVAAGLKLVGPAVLVPGGIGSFIGAFVAAQWVTRR